MREHFLSAIVVTGCLAVAGPNPFPAFAMGRGPEPPPEPRVEKSTLQLIAEAVEKGQIDEDTATLYRVYAVVGDSRLPEEYRGTVPIKDGTPVLRDARSRYDRLRPDVKEAIQPYLFPRGK